MSKCLTCVQFYQFATSCPRGPRLRHRRICPRTQRFSRSRSLVIWRWKPHNKRCRHVFLRPHYFPKHHPYLVVYLYRICSDLSSGFYIFRSGHVLYGSAGASEKLESFGRLGPDRIYNFRQDGHLDAGRFLILLI